MQPEEAEGHGNGRVRWAERGDGGQAMERPGDAIRRVDFVTEGVSASFAIPSASRFRCERLRTLEYDGEPIAELPGISVYWGPWNLMSTIELSASASVGFVTARRSTTARRRALLIR